MSAPSTTSYYELIRNRGVDGVVVLSKMNRRVVGKVLLVKTKRLKTYRYRWIVSKRADGRLMVRTPKIGTLIRDLDLKRDWEYGKVHLLSQGALIDYGS